MTKVNSGRSSPTNQMLIEIWLKKNERNWSYLARRIGVDPAIMTRFKRGHRASAEVIIKLAEFTGLPLKVSFKGCKTQMVMSPNKI